jgi:alkanesulfonate monooxygenase SsuD/methylene tetrahydromethanopterin reductase-like flavin-dependent oxidoreductase (luciferase family)
MSRGQLKLGLALPVMEDPHSREKPSWDLIKQTAQRAEEMGFDTVWVADELLWRVPDDWGWDGPCGFWEGVSMAGAVAACTTTVDVGTSVLSAANRNPGLTVKIAETLDEISNGRFVFGLGSGHPYDFGLGSAFGFPEDHTVSRYEEALEIIVPALRGHTVSFEGEYHRARDLEIRPRGPRPGGIPLMLAGHGPRTMRLAARHADIWNGFATESSQPEWFKPMLEQLDEACADVGRDPATLERSLCVAIDYSEEPRPGTLAGSPSHLANTIARFADVGATSVEIMLEPATEASFDAIERMMDQFERFPSAKPS